MQPIVVEKQCERIKVFWCSGTDVLECYRVPVKNSYA